MIIETLQQLFKRDLLRLKNEIELYNDESRIWHVEKSISNSAGNLCLHLIGNLNTYIGAQIGNTGYIRNRELEFSIKDVPRSEMLVKIDATIAVVEDSLNNVTYDKLQEEYPIIVFAEKCTYAFLLLHLTTHLSYHLGQINYHRRLLDA